MKFQMIYADMTNAEFDGLDAVIASGVAQKATSPSYAATLAANPDAAVPRTMLWDQPTFDGFAGPMYGKSYTDGSECLRYEAWKAYDRLSA